jgi:hypothetical protein
MLPCFLLSSAPFLRGYFVWSRVRSYFCVSFLVKSNFHKGIQIIWRLFLLLKPSTVHVRFLSEMLPCFLLSSAPFLRGCFVWSRVRSYYWAALMRLLNRIHGIQITSRQKRAFILILLLSLSQLHLGTLEGFKIGWGQSPKFHQNLENFFDSNELN